MGACTTASLSIPVDGHLGRFRVLAVVNDAAVSTGARASFETEFCLDLRLGGELLAHVLALFLVS